MCEECKYREDDSKDPKHPCNSCIIWGDDGHLFFRNYEHLKEVIERQ